MAHICIDYYFCEVLHWSILQSCNSIVIDWVKQIAALVACMSPHWREFDDVIVEVWCTATLTITEAVQHRPGWATDVETWKSDCQIRDNELVRHGRWLPVRFPPERNVWPDRVPDRRKSGWLDKSRNSQGVSLQTAPITRIAHQLEPACSFDSWLFLLFTLAAAFSKCCLYD